jgi:CHASE2 domain-containing sensor protein
MPLREHRFLRPVIGAGLTVFCGVLLWGTTPGAFWVNASYDYLFRFGARSVTNPVVLIQMDNHSYEICKQKRGSPWDRSIHAELLNQLARDGARLVVFDALFLDPGDPVKDDTLLRALKKPNGVLLGAFIDVTTIQYKNASVPNYETAHVLMPLEKFLTAVHTNFGIAWLEADSDLIVRRHWPFPVPADLTSLAWKAAQFCGARTGSEPQEQWLRYYGQNGSWASLNYIQATNQAPGYFRGKIVFIGSKPEDPNPAKQEPDNDKFSTPYTHWTHEAVGGMEIQATEFLNLVNGEWLRRPAWWIEMGILIAAGILLGVGLSRTRPARACALAVAAAALVSLAALWLSYAGDYWFPWLVIAGGQAPCALACALIGARVSAPEPLAQTLDSQPAPTTTPAVAPTDNRTDLPDADDYEILHPLGEGSFGKVWLVRNAVNQWQALKAVYLAKFGSNDRPYEREFSGIRRYKPISDKHPGLLRIDFVSTKKKQGYFYYVMELGDALEPGWEKAPSSYKPKDLAKLLALTENHRLPTRECLRIALQLAEALEYLHSQSLTHGDIKPQNIIFVNGQPKLADVGLVNEVTAAGQTQTGPCTPAYVAPGEVAGSPQADIYALGMVLYVMFMGQKPESFPSIATALVEAGEFVRINAVILRACHPERNHRFGSAREMAAALMEIQASLPNELPA